MALLMEIFPSRLETEQIGDEVVFLRGGELEFEDEVEELDGVVQRGEAAIVEVGRGVLDAAQGEGLDRAFGPANVEPFNAKVVHVFVGEGGSVMAGRALAFALEQFFAAQFGGGSFVPEQLIEGPELW